MNTTDNVKHVWDPELNRYVPEKKPLEKYINFGSQIIEFLRARTLIEYGLALAFLLRFVQLGKGAFWYDEGVSIVFSRLSLSQLVNATGADVHPPLYYLILWSIEKIGIPMTEGVARFPSLVFSMIVVWLTWRIINRPELQMSKIGKYAVLLWVIISPLQLHYAQEARMYSLLEAEVLAGILFVLNRRKTFLTIALTLILYTHNYAVFYLPTLGMFALAVRYRYVFDLKTSLKLFLKNWAVYFAIPVILWIPWFIVLVNQMSTVAGGYWIQPVKLPAVIFALYQMLFAYSMPPTFQGLGVLLTCGILIYSGWRVARDRPTLWEGLVVLAFCPLIMSVFVSIVWKPILLFRGLIGSAVPLAVLMVKSIEGIRVKYKQLYAFGLIFTTLIAGVVGHYKYNAINKGTTTTWVHSIEEQMVNGDAVLALNDNGLIAMKTYAPDVPVYKLPSCENEPLGSLSRGTRKALGVTERTVGQLLPRPPKIAGRPDPLQRYSRLYFVSTIAPVSPQCEINIANQIIQSDNVRLIRELIDDEYSQAGIYLIVSKGVY